MRFEGAIVREQGIVFAIGAVACLLVLSHKKAWLASRPESMQVSSQG